jgi:hypothetical protein
MQLAVFESVSPTSIICAIASDDARKQHHSLVSERRSLTRLQFMIYLKYLAPESRPNQGLHIDLCHLRLKIYSKTHFLDKVQQEKHNDTVHTNT